MCSLITHQHEYSVRFPQIVRVCCFNTDSAKGFTVKSKHLSICSIQRSVHICPPVWMRKMRGQRETGCCRDLELDLDIFSSNCSSNQVLIKSPNGSFLKHR